MSASILRCKQNMKVADDKYLVLIFCLLSCLFALVFFMTCYFPIKHGLEGYASRNSVAPEPGSAIHDIPEPIYGRVVLMLIDALRADFVVGEPPLMPFTRQLLLERHGVSFLAKTQPPTVTLPRIKAITTGSIPGFIDVVINFGSSVLVEDNIVTQMKLAGQTGIFFGDETWLTLFPDHFARSDGTTSFFVTDYTEVDINVTRHLSAELVADDWQAMILHYLGLDHIGHLSGPRSPLVPLKLQQMDAVVRQVYSAMELWTREDLPSVLVICGDHGMSDQGGHGGASQAETIVPVVVLSPHITFEAHNKWQNRTERHGDTDMHQDLQQTDLCPTLAAMRGLPVPKNNLGLLEVAALPQNLPIRTKVRLLQLNAAQVASLLERNVAEIDKDHAYKLYQTTLRDHAVWLALENTSLHEAWEQAGMRLITAYQQAIRGMSGRVADLLTHYDMHGIMVAVGLLWVMLGILVVMTGDKALCSSFEEPAWVYVTSILAMVGAMLGHMTACTSQYRSESLCTVSLWGIVLQTVALVDLLLGFFLLLRLFARVLQLQSGSKVSQHLRVGLSNNRQLACCCQAQREAMNWLEACLLASWLLCVVSLMSSSFVEEEHQMWYFFTTSLHLLLLLAAVAEGSTGRGPPLSPTASWGVTGTICLSECKVQEPCHDPHARDRRTLHAVCLHNKHISLTSTSTGKSPESSADFTKIRSCSRSEEGKKPSAFLPDSVKSSQTEHLQTVASLVGILIFCRILRRWNHTGNKWLQVPDVGDWLVRPNNKLELSVLVAVSMLVLFASCMWRIKSWTSRLCFAASLVATYCSKSRAGYLLLPMLLSTGISAQGILEARLSYLFILMLCLRELWYLQTPVITNSLRADARFACSDQQHVVITKTYVVFLEDLQVVWLALMCLLLKPHNVPLVAMVSLLEHLACLAVLPYIGAKPRYLLLYCLAMGQATFFFQGNSNSLSTVDVSAGYIAFSQYKPILIGMQVCASTYSGLAFWLLTCIKFIYLANKSPLSCPLWLAGAFVDVAHMAVVTRVVPLAVYTVLVTVQRHHLFVWTVFSPKLLYEGVLTVVVTIFSAMCLVAYQVLKNSWRCSEKHRCTISGE